MPPRDTAIKLITSYFQYAFHSKNLRWDHDNSAEMVDLVDSLIAAAQATPIYSQAEIATIDARLVQFTQPTKE